MTDLQEPLRDSAEKYQLKLLKRFEIQAKHHEYDENIRQDVIGPLPMTPHHSLRPDRGSDMLCKASEDNRMLCFRFTDDNRLMTAETSSIDIGTPPCPGGAIGSA